MKKSFFINYNQLGPVWEEKPETPVVNTSASTTPSYPEGGPLPEMGGNDPDGFFA